MDRADSSGGPGARAFAGGGECCAETELGGRIPRSAGGGADPLGTLTRGGTARRRRRGGSPGGSQPRYHGAQTDRSGSARKRSALPESGGHGAGDDVDNRSG